MRWLRRIFRRFGIKLVRLPGIRPRRPCPICGKVLAQRRSGEVFRHKCQPQPLFEALEGGKGGAA
jgi:hypothetical protein